MRREPLLIQHHIAKTAGTSLRQVTQANYRVGEIHNIEQLFGFSVARTDWRWERAVSGYRDAYQALAPERREPLRCLVGHSAPFLLQAITDRPVRAFTLLRDPIERVLSLWRHATWLVDATGPTSTVWGPLVLAMRERGWGLKDAYRELGGRPEVPREEMGVFQALFNEQARQVLLGLLDPREIPFVEGGPELESYGDRALGLLTTAYVVGTQDRFSQSVRLLADTFGWRRMFVPHMNVRPASFETDEETRELIRLYNRLDLRLHSHFRDRLSPLPAVGRLAHMRGRLYWTSRRVQRARSAAGRWRDAVTGVEQRAIRSRRKALDHCRKRS